MTKIKTIINASGLLAFLFFSICAQAQLTVGLRALDSEGHEIEQAQVGTPFFLEVSVQGSDKDVADPQIENAPAAGVRRTGYKMSLINGRSNVKYSYLTQLDQPGSHSIGPAVAYDGTSKVSSGVLLLKAGPQEIVLGNDKQNKQTKNLFLQIEADEKKVVVGQKVQGSITFYSAVSNVTLHALDEPRLEGFVREEKSDEKGVEIVNGQRYNFIRWPWSLFCKEAGELIIPSCSVVVSTQDDNDPFSHFSSFFRLRSDRKKIHSNVLSIVVDPLPPYDGTVDAVGQFNTFSASLNQSVAKEGDGIVLTLALEGDGNLEQLMIELQELPHVFKSYSSKQYITPQNDKSFASKSFEFIIQGMEPGQWEIPTQKFTYYDVRDESYKTLKTEPLIIKILPQTTAKNFTPAQQDSPDISTSVDTRSSTIVEDFPLDLEGNWRSVPERKMPWWLFVFLFLTPIGLWLSRWVYGGMRRYSAWRAPRSAWRNAFKVARKKIKRARERNDFSALYKIFVELFVVRCSVSYSAVSDQMINDILVAGGLSSDQVQEWDRFFAQLSAFIFYAAKGTDTQKGLFDQAEKWISIVEKIL